MNNIYLLPFRPSTFSIPIDKKVTTLPTGYSTKESHATGLTKSHKIYNIHKTDFRNFFTRHQCCQ